MIFDTSTRTARAILALSVVFASACGGGGGGGDSTATQSFTVSTNAGANGTISPGNRTVTSGASTTFTITPDSGFGIASVSGCNGSLSGSTYTTGAITGACTVTATFVEAFTVSASAGANGSISPTSAVVNQNDTADFVITPDAGYAIGSVTGCAGSLSDTIYTTAPMTSDCTITATFVPGPPPATAAALSSSITPIKTFGFTWTDVADATFYRLLENPTGSAGFTQVGADVAPGVGSLEILAPLYARSNALYVLQSCSPGGCTDTAPQAVSGNLSDGIGYLKAGGSESGDRFGEEVLVSDDGSFLIVASRLEDSAATGIDGDRNDVSAAEAGAVYVYERDGTEWRPQAYIKASNTESDDQFGWDIAINDDATVLAVGATREDSAATGIDGDQTDNTADGSGAVYVYERTGNTWSQQAYIKASNTDPLDAFGAQVALSADGSTLAVGAFAERSAAVGINGDQADNSLRLAGAVYVFVNDGSGWAQQAYIKASNTGDGDFQGFGDAFGGEISISDDGNTLAVSAVREASNATGINGDQNDNSAFEAGAAYVFTRSGTTWTQEAYLKASNTGRDDRFAQRLHLSGDGDTLAVAAVYEDSDATGVNGDQSSTGAGNAGAVYLFQRAGGAWAQEAYIKASNTGSGDEFGRGVSLSDDGDLLAVGAMFENSNALGIDGDQSDDSSNDAGAAYVFSRSGGSWSQIAYLKASNTDEEDRFGTDVSLSGNGDTLAVGATHEQSTFVGINPPPNNNNGVEVGAVYVY